MSVLPAHAGMVPAPVPRTADRPGAPRARGDGPYPLDITTLRELCSPRTRGWSPGLLQRPHKVTVLPAHAGMVPGRAWYVSAGRCAPRARGDGPRYLEGAECGASCSPRTRGWSLRLFADSVTESVLPAHAGMVPGSTRGWKRRRCAPRARGDGPRGRLTTTYQGHVLPAHAGMVPVPGSGPSMRGRAPRARGDGPQPGRFKALFLVCSPRTRGWSTHTQCSPRTRGWSCVCVLPAHAGMVPGRRALHGLRGVALLRPGAPRARGDGPGERNREWRSLLVLPAHAGMVPTLSLMGGGSVSAPRARGDGPGDASVAALGIRCSPRTRGWSRRACPGCRSPRVLPAHAGMVPRSTAWTRTRGGAPRARGDGPREGVPCAAP